MKASEKKITTFGICDKYIIGNGMIENEKRNFCPFSPDSHFRFIWHRTSDLFCSALFCTSSSACVRAVCFSFVVFFLFWRLHTFPIFLELNESQFVVRIFNIFFVWPWTNNIFDPLFNSTGSDGAMFRQVETPYSQKKHVHMHNAHTQTHKRPTEWSIKRWMSHPLLKK